jgi:hypothetical protein
MKLATKAASPLNSLSGVILPRLDEYLTDDDIYRARSRPLNDKEVLNFWDDTRKETSSRTKVLGAAHSNRVERELFERFGVLRHVTTHRYSLQMMSCADAVLRTRLTGNPILPLHTCIVILFMAYQGRMPLNMFFVLACFLFTVHPFLVIILFLFMGKLISRKPATQIPLASESSLATGPANNNVMVYGGGVRGLYTGALLACAGQRVTVLIPQSSCDGGANVHPKGAPCEFVLERCEFGQVSKFEALLSPCLHVTKPVIFEPVGCAQTGWVHAVLFTGDLSQPVPLRSGSRAWVDDISRAFGTDHSILAYTLQQVAMVFKDMIPFMVAKLPDDPCFMRLRTWNRTSSAADYFTRAARITTAEAASRIAGGIRAPILVLDLLERICAVCGLRRELECTPPEKISFAAWCASVAHSIDGYHVPKGGASHLCASLRATIEAHGGEIQTDTVVQSIRFVDDRNPSAGIVTTARRSGIVETLCTTKVVLGVDASECFRLLRDTRERCNLTTTGERINDPLNQPQAQLIVRTLIAFPGTCKDLDTPQAVPVFWRKQSGCPILPDDETKWRAVTFRDATNGIVACVVESHSSPIMQAEFVEPDRTRFHLDLLHAIARLFPETEGKAQFVTSLTPSPCGSPHVPTRYSTGSEALKPAVDDLDGVFLALDDFALSNAAGSVIAGYLAAHAVLGYTSNDVSL